MPRTEVYFHDEEKLKLYKKESKELGFNSFSDFIRFSIVFTLKNYEKEKNPNITDKLDHILNILNTLELKNNATQDKLLKSVHHISRELRENSTGKEKRELIDKAFEIIGNVYPQTLTFAELVEKMGITDNPRLVNMFREVVIQDPLFNDYIERRGDKFIAFENPSGRFASVEFQEL
ncbi:hypothetical protein [Methanococcus maripaludis]|uniref:Uncharacterized protein n=2 Tax=Methanococcus maripaludis TaxID=39152 RepID=A0A7J9PH24_METMI|nr:hypothetical protein [Methanococcus maripaludis]MBA2862056.1 hypothetical protein [Methanococcus maripaludis]